MKLAVAIAVTAGAVVAVGLTLSVVADPHPLVLVVRGLLGGFFGWGVAMVAVTVIDVWQTGADTVDRLIAEDEHAAAGREGGDR